MKAVYLLALLGLLGCILASPSVGEESTPEPQEELSDPCVLEEKKRNAIFIIVCTIICLSITFDFVKDKLEEATEGALSKVVDSLWGELTVLGFIGLVVFVFSKTDILVELSRSAMGEDHELGELVESLHFLLFAMMIGYIVVVVLLIVLARKIEKQYGELEDKCTNIQRVSDEYCRYLEKDETPPTPIKKLMRYMTIRQQFISPVGHKLPPQKLPRNFDFASYLDKSLGSFLQQLVHIRFTTWVSVLIIAALLWQMAAVDGTGHVWLFGTLGYIIAATALLFRVKLIHISDQLLPPMPTLHRDLSERSQLLDTSPINYYSGNEDSSSSPMWPPRGLRPHLPKFLKREVRAAIGSKSNRHESVFWMGSKGPKFHFQVTQFLLLSSVLYIAVIVIAGGKNAWVCKTSVIEGASLLVYLIIPIAGVAFITPGIIRTHVLVTSIEMMKDNKLVLEVVREMKTKASLTALKLVQTLVYKDSKKKSSKEKRKKLSDKDVSNLSDVFFLFDKDKSGAITIQEFTALLHSLGVANTPEEVSLAVKEIDEDGSGEITLDEFVTFMEARLDTDLDEEESVKLMFEFFDKDKNGLVSAQELYDTVMSLGVDFTIDEIRAIVSEVDKSGDGNVNIEEFAKLIRRHLGHMS